MIQKSAVVIICAGRETRKVEIDVHFDIGPHRETHTASGALIGFRAKAQCQPAKQAGSIKPGAQAPGPPKKHTEPVKRAAAQLCMDAVARFTGSMRILLSAPGACAPGFMLPPASQANTALLFRNRSNLSGELLPPNTLHAKLRPAKQNPEEAVPTHDNRVNPPRSDLPASFLLHPVSAFVEDQVITRHRAKCSCRALLSAFVSRGPPCCEPVSAAQRPGL